ncbi:MAG TPA: hypothetical protein VK959_10790 [Methylophilaceae bacterium]|jgi:hypothetical protein|uniref:hypothetical protein n=1 Tax=Methylobacillus sp. MM3 TaxID=1848039 RepID=UPI0007E15C8A|nr:hypothetical protein [Methylobacillus sp. MM3]OAJ70935.1 hypothetical protein A7976_05655 [Methylobacillus sp. MM3]HSI23495.1 hypothetical protein [Methylophilaceae bacterium]
MKQALLLVQINNNHELRNIWVNLCYLLSDSTDNRENITKLNTETLLFDLDKGLSPLAEALVEINKLDIPARILFFEEKPIWLFP